MVRLPGPVFLSHSSTDKDFVFRVRDDLNQRGFETWVDAHDIHGGDALPGRIANGIAGSSAMVVFISQAAIESRWLAYELQIGVKRMIEGHMAIIPALLEDVRVPTEISALLYADFVKKDYDDALRTVVTALEQREPEDVWITHEIERILDAVFDGRGIISTPGEYRSADFDFVEVDIGYQGAEATIVYEIARALSDSSRALSHRYWQEYLEAQDDAPEPYSLLITERPLDFELPVVEGTDGRLRVFDRPAPPSVVRKYLPTIFVVDISGGATPETQQQLLDRVRELVFERESEYVRAARDAQLTTAAATPG